MPTLEYSDEIKDIILNDDGWEDEVYTYDPDNDIDIDIEYLYG